MYVAGYSSQSQYCCILFSQQTLTGHGNKVLCAKFLEDSKVVSTVSFSVFKCSHGNITGYWQS